MLNAIDYSGRRVVVTGCFSGIGHATARLLIAAGAVVHGLDVRPTDLALASFDVVDLVDRSAIDRATGAIAGPVDALFTCAGLAPTRPSADVLRVNFLGTRYLTERIVEMMGQGGAIVTTASNGGVGWRENLPKLLPLLDTHGQEAETRWLDGNLATIGNAYSFAKEAVIAWTLHWSAQLIAERGTRINCTSPGAVETPMLTEIAERVPAAAIDAVARPIGRRSTPDEQARVLLFLNSDDASYINGANLPVDGGFAATLPFRV